ncbi:endonuclease/exonuclease/phosphatase family protein [soil metagenome]
MQIYSTSKKTHLSFVRFFYIALFIVAAFSTFLGFFGKFHWFFDLFSHFREYYLLLFIFLSICGIVLKERIFSALAIIFMLINLILFIPFYLPTQSPKPTIPDSLLVFMANVQTDNHEYAKVVTYVKKVDPDIVVLEETDANWIMGIQELENIYPYSVREVMGNNFGIILLSKYKLENEKIIKVGEDQRPSIIATVSKGTNKMTIIATHPVPPFSKRNSRQRDDQLEKLSQLADQQTLPTIFVGDLNSTPFSYPYIYLTQETKLIDCARGFGYQRTWQYNPIMPPIRLSLDHCLRTPDITVLESYVGEDVGSDHLPVINRVYVKKIKK